MSDNPEVLRANIERTRANLSLDVDAVADKVNPSHIVDRQTEKIKEGVRGGVTKVKETIMGAADQASDAAHSGASGLSDVPHQAVRRAQGNPLAAGLIAFGAGMLLSSLFPASQKEAEAAEALKSAAEPLTAQVAETAKDVAQGLQEPAQNAMESVKEAATDAVSHVKEEGQSAAGDVQERVGEAKDNIAHD